jgi:hypothetical protein
MKTKRPAIAEERASFTLGEICARNAISLSKLNDLRRAGRGPKLMYIDRLIRVSVEAEREWLKQLENPTDDQQEKIEAQRRLYSEIGSIAGKAAAASPHHISHKNKRAAEARRKKATARRRR